MTTPHPHIASFMQRQGLAPEQLRSDGRLTLVVDDRYRVHMAPCANGGLALIARVMSLPEDRVDRQDLIDRVLKKSAALLQKHPSTLTVDPHEDALHLQQIIPQEELNPDSLDSAMGEFTNALSYWTTTGITS